MKIFLSYASERREIAEPIAFSLRSRGFDVFLDRDDLPAGRSFDEQIERAIDAADLFIFLISPESIDRGRFTLTEVEFARRRWRKADGAVLPVLIAPTDLVDVPAYLRSVNILEPAGNVAAEVSAAVAAMTRPPVMNRIVPSAFLAGVASGTIAGIYRLPIDAIPSGNPEELAYLIHEPTYAPASVPVLFAVGACAWLWFFERPSLFRVLVFFPIFVALGWLAAINISFNILFVPAEFADESAGVDQITMIIWFAAGALSGFTGALFTWAGVAIAVARTFRLYAMLMTVMTGTVAGLLIYPALSVFEQPVLLFAPWQGLVAGCLAWSLSNTPR